MTEHESFDPEEPWEAEIGALLGGLPTVDPPPGFLASAVDHRPLYAGRMLLGLLTVVAAALTMAIAGGFDDADSPIPEPDLRQAVSDSGGDAVSVLVQNGQLDWETLPPSGRQLVAGEEAWVDDDLKLTVLQAGNDTITIVGMSSDEVSSVLGSLSLEETSTLYERARDVAGSIAEALGFPSTG